MTVRWRFSLIHSAQFGMSAEDAAEVRLAVFAFGSYRLGVNSQGAFLKSLLFSA